MRAKGPVQRLLYHVLVVQTSHPLLTLVAAGVLTVLSALYTVTYLGFLTSQKELISPSDRLMKLSEQMEPFEDLDTFVVAIENRDAPRTLHFLHALVTGLKADREHYREIFFRVDPEGFKRWALLYLEKNDLRSLRDSLRVSHRFLQTFSLSPGLVPLFRQINQEMTSTMVGELFTGFLEPKSESKDELVHLDFLIRLLRGVKKGLEGDLSATAPWKSFFSLPAWEDAAGEGYRGC